MGNFELEALGLVDELEGKVPFMIYGGNYSEPLMNPYILPFLSVTKKYGSYFGIHTNGSYLYTLEEVQGLLTQMCSLATDRQDYLSISLDAGFPHSHRVTKNTGESWFWEIIDGIEAAVKVRGERGYPSIRVCYLLNKVNSGRDELEHIVRICKELGVDSLRFSIPYDLYGLNFKKVKHYKEVHEVGKRNEYEERLEGLLSDSESDRPYVFYLGPEMQDVDRMCFRQCIYSYYQITLGADGVVYRCSSTATPTFPANQLGEIPNSLSELEDLILANHNPNWTPQTCWEAGARCNRMALEINTKWEELNA